MGEKKNEIVVWGAIFVITAILETSLDLRKKFLHLLYIRLRKPLRDELRWWISRYRGVWNGFWNAGYIPFLDLVLVTQVCSLHKN